MICIYAIILAFSANMLLMIVLMVHEISNIIKSLCRKKINKVAASEDKAINTYTEAFNNKTQNIAVFEYWELDPTH